MSSPCRVWCEACTNHAKHIATIYKGKIIPFSDFAACRLLQVTPSSELEGPVYTAICELAKDYLRADIESISKCIAKFGLDTLLGEVADASKKPVHKMPLVRDLLCLMERLLLEYLSENWDLIEDVLSVNREQMMSRVASEMVLKKSDPARLRAQKNWKKAYRYAIKELLLQTLGVQRQFSTLATMFTQIHGSPSQSSLAEASRSKKRRHPILLMLGGGMAAGKSTVREIIGSDKFWSKVGKDAVVVEADAIKNQDIVYKLLQERFGDDPSLSQMVHEYSTTSAEAMLVSAINNQSDIVFDGTMTWFPFVEQTINMVRDHEHNYKRGPGYYHDDSGKINEVYWEIDEENKVEAGSKIPYRIELVGVTCDPGLAVARGIWRKIKTGRGVPISSQLRSHRLFSQNFEAMAKLVDSATLYHTGSNLTTFSHSNEDINSPKVICHSSSVTRGELLVNPEAFKEFQKIKDLDDSANSISTLYSKADVRQNGHRTLGRTLTASIAEYGMQHLRESLREAHRGDSISEDDKLKP